ncbi:uncharacterized protein BXZ73DRAFT_107048 [Epithele typhae]|uniref:uncharacterized protein n=1 Tax=Epithele typhae TaxID=378194 RepID=UPI0020087431|nr:uncharacterized protein BXZ73DRAFT_107048 [Epithele typhae]KAH9913072.1 hypothetical protein BXZ73DRAFT_107048 [Epithele typhae]
MAPFVSYIKVDPPTLPGWPFKSFRKLDTLVTLKDEVFYDCRATTSANQKYQETIKDLEGYDIDSLMGLMDADHGPSMLEFALREMSGCRSAKILGGMDIIELLQTIVRGCPHPRYHLGGQKSRARNVDELLALRALAAAAWVYLQMHAETKPARGDAVAHRAPHSLLYHAALYCNMVAERDFIPRVVIRVAIWIETVAPRWGVDLYACAHFKGFGNLRNVYRLFRVEQQGQFEQQRMKAPGRENRYRCAAPGCGIYAVNMGALKKCAGKCSGPSKAYYCSKQCQARHWVVHQSSCRKIARTSIPLDDGDPDWVDVGTFDDTPIASDRKADLNVQDSWRPFSDGGLFVELTHPRPRHPEGELIRIVSQQMSPRLLRLFRDTFLDWVIKGRKSAIHKNWKRLVIKGGFNRFFQFPSPSGPERAVGDADEGVLTANHLYVLIYLLILPALLLPNTPPSVFSNVRTPSFYRVYAFNCLDLALLLTSPIVVRTKNAQGPPPPAAYDPPPVRLHTFTDTIPTDVPINEPSAADTQATIPRLHLKASWRSPEPTPDGYSNLVDSWSVGVIVIAMLMQGTPFDADPPNTDIHTNITTRRVQWTPLYECDVSEQAERFIRALFASSPSERMSLSTLCHPWLATEAELEGAPRPLPATPPALRTASLQSPPTAPSFADSAPAAEPAHTPPPAAPPMAPRRPPGTASLLRMDGERAASTRSAAGSCRSLDGPSLILVVHPPSLEHAATPVRDADADDDKRRLCAVVPAVRREREEPARQAPAADMGAWAVGALGEVGGGPVGEPAEELEPRAMEATRAREKKTLKDETLVRKSPMRKGVKRKPLPEESGDEGEGEGDGASLLPQTQTQEREDSEGESPRVARRLWMELSMMSIANVDGTD